MATTYFIDESGNSGDIASQQALENFAEQPIFSLACIGIEDKLALDNFVCELIKKYKIQAKELKSTSICNKKRYIIKDVVNFLIDNSGKILVEIVDKKYQLCSALTDYYVFYKQVIGDKENIANLNFRKRTVCDFIYYNISEEQLKNFIDSLNGVEGDVSLIERCFFNIKLLFKKDDQIPNYWIQFVNESKDEFEKIKNKEGNIIAKKKFLPLPDFSGGKNMEYCQMSIVLLIFMQG